MPNDPEWGWHGLCFQAMNTRVETQLYTNHHDQALEGVQRMFDKAEKHMTRFDQASELCQLNRSAGHARRVSPLLFDAVEAALWAASVTHGLFDPSLLRTLEAAGYDRSFEQIAQDAPAELAWPATQRGAYVEIGLDHSRREIYLPPGLQLDLGGIGKGWTVDRAADWLAGHGPFMVNAGGDLYAYGAPPASRAGPSASSTPGSQLATSSTCRCASAPWRLRPPAAGAGGVGAG